ncbi:MAG: class I SAM-dependent methyltransferase [Armatimonadota bacterium]
MSQEPCPSPIAYGDVAPFYDKLMRSVPHAMWISRIEAELRSRGRYPRAVLDVACGTGIGTMIVHNRGYHPVVGVDISGGMIRLAQRKAEAANAPIVFLEQDAAQLDLGDARFDWALSLFDSLNYVLEPDRLRAAFRSIARHLVPGGIFTFDMNSDHALRTHMFTQDDNDDGLRHEWTAHWDEHTSLCRVEMDFWVAESGGERHFHETHWQRGYRRDEVLAMLQEAGFIRSAVYGNYGTRTPNARSDRWLFVTEVPQ